MIPKDIKFKYANLIGKIDVKNKLSHRKNVFKNYTKGLINGKNYTPYAPAKKNEKKPLMRKYTSVTKEKSNNGSITQKNSRAKYIDTNFRINPLQYSSRSLKDLETFIHQKFVNKYIKNFYKYIKITEDNIYEKISIYNIYQANKLINDQRCRLRLSFEEHKYYFNLEDYMIDSYSLIESNILLKFLLYFIYRRDTYANKEHKENEKIIKFKIKVFKNFVTIIQNNLEKIDNYEFSILEKIVYDIRDITNSLIRRESIINMKGFSKIRNNIIKYFIGNIDNLEVLGDYLIFIPILLKISLIKINVSLPNSFSLGKQINIYLNEYIIKRKTPIKIDIFNTKNKTLNNDMSKTSNFARKINYNKSFYNEHIKKNNSFSSNEDLNPKKEEVTILDYSFNAKKSKNIIKRQTYDPEIKGIEILLNNFQFFNKRNNKKTKNTKASFDINKKRRKDALLNKMIKFRGNKSLSDKKPNNNRYQSINNIKNFNNFSINNININNNFFTSRIHNHNKNCNGFLTRKNKRKTSLRKNKSDRTSFEDKNTMYKSNVLNKSVLNNNTINKNNRNSLLSSEEIKQYSFRKFSNKNFPFKIIQNLNKNNSTTNKDSIILLRSTNSATSFRNNLYNTKDSKIKKNSFILPKGSSSQILSKNLSIKKDNFTPNDNIKQDKTNKYKFKDVNEFILELLKNSTKYTINQVLLENIESINNNPNNKYSIEYKSFFTRRIFRYFPEKYFEKNENVWKYGEYKDSRFKSNYVYNLLMMKIQKQMQKNKEKYKNLLDKEINVRQISKSADIYL